ncbi:hypothetical protein HYC85_017102 [Camellia sinensis]|uniref:Multiple inositol polyphosphate phosphatase 1 n=1 Tax=Camellia sinensis TaxID=4442 RepID=A0A7J7H4U1_CAMSI|nr:hypothetical protein HYC85_017102 [Camellia sinensis]
MYITDECEQFIANSIKVGKRKAATKADKGGKSQAKKGKLAKKDPNKPKRPPSAFFVSTESFNAAIMARHGTRAATKEKLKELNDLAMRMEVLLQDAKEQKLALQKVPAWFRGWKSPWQGKLKGGELISEGEDKLYNLGVRTRDKFPQLFNEDYHPNVYAIKATQEASLLNIIDQACALFTPSEVVLLEWTDDLELFILKGYGNALNYQMGVPLVEDVVQSMEQAIMAKDDFEKIEKEQPLQLPPKPPQRRNWRGSVAVPFGWQ